MNSTRPGDGSLTRRDAVRTTLAICAASLAADTPKLPPGFTLTGENWTYEGDDLSLNGILVVPEGRGPFPAIIISHGAGGNIDGFSLVKAREIVKWGFVCIATNYTFAGPRPSRPEVATPSTLTQMWSENVKRAAKCILLLESLPNVDRKRIAAYGNSAGAVLTVFLSAEMPDKIAAAAITAGGIGGRFTPADAAEKVRCPFLMVHGSADKTVSPETSVALKELLDRNKIPNKRVVFDGIGHNVHGDKRDEVFASMREWFTQYGVLYAQTAPPVVPPRAVRFKENPIIRPEMPTAGNDINGPSLILAPRWLANPLGRYYLYFAGHRGTMISLAFADDLAGPWKIHEAGVLPIERTACHGHIASPDVHVVEGTQEVRMYFHGPILKSNEQRTFLAVSKDGIHFTASPEDIGEAYFRVFQWGGSHYAISNGGMLHRSPDGASKFEPGPNIFPQWADRKARHVAVKMDGDLLSIFYTRIGDNPERILFATLRMTPDWKQWRASEGSLVLQPELKYEGADLPLQPSNAGPSKVRVRQLRDPAIYREGARTYLLYSVAGESGIGIAELR